MWNLGEESKQTESYLILKEFAESLSKESNGYLIGDVFNHTYADSEERLRIYHSLQINIKKLNHLYKFIEVEQVGEAKYPVNLKVFFYSGIVGKDNISDSQALRDTISDIIGSKNTGALLRHLIDMGELKIESSEE